MPKVGKGATKVVGIVLDIVQSALAILVVVLVSWKMMSVTRTEVLQFNTKCLLDGTGRTGTMHGIQFCIYAVAVGIISLIATAVLRCANRCLGCLTANVCTKYIDMIIDVVLLVWWALAFILFLKRGMAANKANFPEEPARNGIIAAAFGAAFSFGLDIIFTLCGLAAS